MKQDLALFDFDGTISNKDSMVEFFKFTHGNWGIFKGLIANIGTLLKYKQGSIPNWQAKEIILDYFYGKQPKETLEAKGKTFGKTIIPKILRPQALERLKWHQDQGHRLIIVSASAGIWIRGWLEDQNLEYLCTEVAYDQHGLFNGKLASKNCYGAEKVNRIKSHLNLEEFSKVYAYGDSGGDTEMLAIADEPHFKPFR